MLNQKNTFDCKYCICYVVNIDSKNKAIKEKKD